MPRRVPLSARFRELFRSAFFQLPRWKKRLLWFAILLVVAGGVGAVANAGGATGSGESSGWSWAALSSGFGCVCGFVVGAALRLFLKLALLFVGLAAAVMFGLSYLGWVELPWTSFDEVYGALSDGVHRAFSSLQTLLTGYLPSSVMSGLGVASGITQRPDTDPGD